MIVKIHADGMASLEDVDNFKAFKAVCETASGLWAPPASQTWRREGRHVWIARNWIEQNGRPQDGQWLASLEGMIEYASSVGWVDEDGAVRAHVEVAAPEAL